MNITATNEQTAISCITHLNRISGKSIVNINSPAASENKINIIPVAFLLDFGGEYS
jgi:hypothetical protein